MPNPENQRLREAYDGSKPWLLWGPYLSERQWGTVREDYSPNGDAWAYFTHQHSSARAYRWGEDGLAGFCDEQQRLCLAIALWNGRDPILKERLFGLTNAQGNHGEDVKEYYFYLDQTPTHSFARYLYKYPQAEYPYQELVDVNRARSRTEPEYELLDTGIFNDDRYFDVEVVYAKESPKALLWQITVHNRGPEAAELHLLPHIWFRNTWAPPLSKPKPKLRAEGAAIRAEHPELGIYWLHTEANCLSWFTDNETNYALLFDGENEAPYVKDAFHRALIRGETEAVNPAREGTKACFHQRLEIAPGGSAVLRLRLGRNAEQNFGPAFDALVEQRRSEADAFYASLLPEAAHAEEKRVLRQALAGMLWTKQFYFFDLDQWLEEHGAHPFFPITATRQVPNAGWMHMINRDIISMPDKWEYPWYATWDLAFHTLPLAMVDVDFAKQQLQLMLHELYMHPSGQMPAYEWNFGDVNPPVHAWAVLVVYSMDKEQKGRGDLTWLKNAFQKLLLNFTWWVNREDPTGRNVFQGGFLGLDNIGLFDRSKPLPTGGHLEQADGTGWMALYSQNMLEIALELAAEEPAYEDIALKFLEHFLFIASAMDRLGDRPDEMWDVEDGFFYDLLRLPDGQGIRLKVRSMVGLLPLCAVTVISKETFARFPRLWERAQFRFDKYPELLKTIHDPRLEGIEGRHMVAVLDEGKLRRMLHRLLDEGEFLSPHGIRALSRAHLEAPYRFEVHGETYEVKYLPGESDSGMFGGNSNWRGPVWFPVNTLILRALLQYYSYYGDDFTIEYPTGSGRSHTLFEIAQDLADRLIRIFLPDADGRRPVFGAQDPFQRDPHWKDHLLFYEYFHGEDGRGLGASHQTGWTGLVAWLIQLRYGLKKENILADGLRAAVVAREP